MAISNKMADERLRQEHLNIIIDTFLSKGEDVVRVNSNEIAYPVVDTNDNEKWIVVTVKVPTGANKGLEPYDGYELAKDYERKRLLKTEKEEKQRKRKLEKIKRDEEIRRKKKEILENKGE